MGSSRPPTSNTVDQPTTLRELYKQIDWLNALLIVGIPLYGCVQAFWVPLRPATAAFAVAYYFLTGLGITAGKLHCQSFYRLRCKFSASTSSHLSRRLPQTMVSSLILCNHTLTNYPRTFRRRCSRRLHQMVGQRSPCAPQIHRHSPRSLLGAKGPPVRSHRLDAHETRPKAKTRPG